MIDIEKEFSKAYDLDLGLTFAKEFDLTEEQINRAKKEQETSGKLFSSIIFNMCVVKQMFDMVKKEEL
jgi:hypothetical protein